MSGAHDRSKAAPKQCRWLHAVSQCHMADPTAFQGKKSGKKRSTNSNFWARISQARKNSLNIKFLGGIFLGHPGPRRRDIPDKNFMQVAFFCCFRQGVAGMSRDLGRDVPDLEKLYARELWADFSYPIIFPVGWRSSMRSSERQNACYVPRSPRKTIFWQDIPGF